MLSRIHVNRHNVAANRKDGGDRPAFIVKSYKGTRRGNNVTVFGPSVMVYKPTQPLDNGAVAWVETTAPVEVG